MIKKYLNAEIKSANKDEGTFEIVASSGETDRMGDAVSPKGWYVKNCKNNPVILWHHSTGGLFGSVAIPPVARAEKVWIEDEKELKIKGRWAETPFAQELKTLVEGGFLNAVSVGFLPLVEDTKGHIEIEGKMYRRAIEEEIEKGLYDSKYGEKFTKQELLEVSWVNVPALPQALVTARKMNLALITKALEEIDIGKADDKIETIKPEVEKELPQDKIESILSRMSEVEKAIKDLEEMIKTNNADSQKDPKDYKPEKGTNGQIDKEAEIKLLKLADKAIESLLLKLRK